MTAMQDIMKTAITAGNFKTLIRLVQKAAFTNTLTVNGPLTVFAPSDESFAKLPQEKIELLLKDKDRLMTVLKSHVHTGKIPSSSFSKLKKIKMMNGKELAVDTTKGIRIDTAKVTKPDIECTNGIIHVIDSVIQLK